MATDKTDELEIHPVIKTLESTGEVAVQFHGFVGAGDETTFRLYADLGMSAYVDIPRDAVMHAETDKAERGKARVFVRANQKVLEVRRHPVWAEESAFSVGGFRTTGNNRDFPEPERGGVFGCYGRCESAFAIQAGIITGLRSRQAIDEALKAEAQAFGVLKDCINQCRIAYPTTLFPPPPVEEVVAAIGRKYGFTYTG